jgi:hypothetical protein
MKVQVTIEQDYCLCGGRIDHVACLNGQDFTYEADVPDSLIGPISEPVQVAPPSSVTSIPWASIQPPYKRDMLLEDLWLRAELLSRGSLEAVFDNSYWWGHPR